MMSQEPPTKYTTLVEQSIFFSYSSTNKYVIGKVYVLNESSRISFKFKTWIEDGDM